MSTIDLIERPSPLGLVSRDPALQRLVDYLAHMRERLQASPGETQRLVFSRDAVASAREAFARMIQVGESRLHRLGACLSDSLFIGPWELESVVFAQVETTRERFRLSQILEPEDLSLYTDLALGTRQLDKLRWHDGESFCRASLVANMVEYHPSSTAPHGIYKLLTRIKAEEEIWNKVVDELFDLDAIVRGDKKRARLSRYVKDVFGLKIVAASRPKVQRIHEELLALRWDDAFLEAHGVTPSDRSRRLELVEVKDYLGGADRKRSGWSAVKSVFRWNDGTFEIQVQPLRNHLRERERLTSESHAGFKARRETLRDEIAREVPLFGFYRDLLKWLFVSPDRPPPVFEGVTVELRH